MRKKIWIIRDLNRMQQMALSQALSISPVTASVLLARGITSPQEASRWLSSETQHAHDPYLLPEMEKVVDRLFQARTTRETVCFYGDYDVDGISATSVYLTFFHAIGGKGMAYIPHRLHEGYGLNEGALRRLRREGVGLVVTSDCGTTSHHEIGVANELGLDVMVTDHHQPGDHLPAAYALLNPYRSDSLYPFKGLCSAALAWKVAEAYRMKYGCEEIDLDGMHDLVALATVADVVPLQDENRGFVRKGLAQLSRGTRCGIRALKQVAAVNRDCTAETIAFRLAPRINAAGRMAHALDAVRLLTTDSESEAQHIAEDLEQLNRARQQVEETILLEALATCDQSNLPGALVLGSRRWHLGVVGIVAARLVERFHCPAIVIAINEQGIGKGSARTVPGLNLYEALFTCRDLLDSYGGHPSAAGLTIQESRLPEFRNRFLEHVRAWSGQNCREPTLHVDAEVRLDQVDHRLVRELGSLHPFGAGNPEPTLAVRNLAVMSSRVVGEKHLKLTVRQGNSIPFDSIGFRMGSLADLGLSAQRPVDLVFVPELNHWNGYDRIQLRIRDVKPSQVV